MLILRIRQAEVAAAAGRLDEAYELVARDGRFRSHRRGQDAVTRIIQALVRRGREHLSAGRLPQAGADCEKAGRLGGGDLPDLAQLRADLQAAHEDRQRGQRDAALAVAAARRHVEAGALSMGARLLGNVNGDSRAKRLMNEIDEHRTRLDSALAAARTAADRGDWSTAAEAIARAREIRPTDPQVIDISLSISQILSEHAQSEITAGRLDRAAQTASLLRTADPSSVVARDIHRALEHCTDAWERLERARPHEAAELLRRVENLFPRMTWLSDVLKQVAAAADAIAQLRAGPLSLASDVCVPRVGRPAEPPMTCEDALRPPIRGASGGEMPDRFILQVDGAGAFLVVRSGVAKVGPISSSVLPEVALIAEATAPAITIERVEDDYFLRSASQVSVNEKPIKDALLSSGDRIALSPRCRFTFALPHPASTTAVLDLNGARYPRGDVRRVILLDRDLILGPSSASHVRVSGLTQPVVLNLRGGMLRPNAEATVAGKPLARDEGLPVGVPIAAGGASFVISRV